MFRQAAHAGADVEDIQAAVDYVGSLGDRYAAGLMGHSTGGATAFMHAAQLGSIPAVWVIEPGPMKTISSKSLLHLPACFETATAGKCLLKIFMQQACLCHNTAWHASSAASCVCLHLISLIRELLAVPGTDVASPAMDQ